MLSAHKPVRSAPLLPSLVSRSPGKERDSETGLDYFGARYYGSTMGRFSGPDEPFVDQDEGDPQSWNLYGYARNNPVRNFDPTGEACVSNGKGGWEDDDSGGESCADVDRNNQTDPPSINVSGNGSGAETQPSITSEDLNPFNDRAPLAFQGFVNLVLNGQLRRGGTQLLLGLGGAAVLNAVSLAKNTGQIVIPAWRLKHVLDAHTIAKIGPGGKSAFVIGEDIVGLIKAAESAAPVAQTGSNFEKVVDAGRIIGVTREGNPTTVYTVITNSSNQLVTAFPGTPK